MNQKLSEDLRIKSEQVEVIQKRLIDFTKKKEPDEDIARRLKRKDEEIQNLSEGLARITDFVYSLPIITSNPEETNIIDSTIKAIS